MVTGSILKAAFDKTSKNNFAASEWMSGVVMQLLKNEAVLIRNSADGRAKKEDLATFQAIAKDVSLRDYNDSLRKALTPSEYKRLCELRNNYGYASSLESPVEEKGQK
jgi:hypothetical protein